MTTTIGPAIGAQVRPAGRARLAALLRGAADEAAWVRPAHVGVGVLAAVLYLVNLTVSGFANTYYSAAALAASQSWSAWFFGSIDSANFITVDKPPLATMLMGLSVRIFGLSSWSVLLPEALAGVGTVVVLFAIVKRSFGPAAGLIAAVVAALTPAAVLMFRYNNPDALMTFLLVLAAGAFLRGLETGRTRWVIAAAVLVGFAFNTKYLQAYLVLPAFVVSYAIAGRGGVARRLGTLLASGLAVLVSSGWWILAVELLPAAMRPYIGGSTNNSALDLVFGYDGLGRIFGQGGPGGGGGGGGGFSGTPGLLRLFNAELGGQIAWLIPAAVIGLGVGLVLRGRAPRTDGRRAAYLMWGLWLAVHAAVFSLMSGIIHSYYAVAMAPAIGALVGAGVVDLWSARRKSWLAGAVLGAMILGSGIVAWQLLARAPDFVPGLGVAIVAVSALTAAIVALPAAPARSRVPLLAAGLGIAMLLAGPAAYAIDTIATAYGGGDPTAGPAIARVGGGPGGTGGPAGGGRAFVGAPPAGALGSGGPDAATADSALVDYLLANRGNATWIVAVRSANQAGSIELASGAPVMAMGGFSGSDPAPTLAELKAFVASGQLRYILIGNGGFGGPGGGSGGGDSAASGITAWVQSVGTVVDYGGSGGTLYDLSAAFGS